MLPTPTAPAAATKTPWYRRIFKRQAKAVAAGVSVGGVRPPTSLRKGRSIEAGTIVKGGLALLVGLGVIGFFAFPSLQGIIIGNGGRILHDIRMFIAPEQYPVYATAATATSETTDHPASLLIDRVAATDWRSPEVTPSVKLTFDTTFDLAAVRVFNGTAENFVGTRRPTKLAFIFADGSRIEKDLVDDQKPQLIEISANGVRAIEIQLVAPTGPSDAPIALAEVEFIGKR